MPVLLPGILELSRRARYLSFYAFLLEEYKRRRLPANAKSLSMFIRRREWELGLAVQRCPNDCRSSPVGARKLSSLATGTGPFRRGESVESAFGGYGLYYRSPLVEFGVVAKAGTMLGSEPIPIDILYGTDRAQRLADGFRSAVRATSYYRREMWTNDDLPAEVIDEYAEAACLCRLRELPDERDAVHEAMLGSDQLNDHAPAATAEAGAGASLLEAVVQRRRSVAHYLTLVGDQPDVVSSDAAYRESLWVPPRPRSDAHATVAGQWAALIAKDVWQEAICSVWSEFCRAGLARTRTLGRDLTWDEVRQVTYGLVTGPPRLDADGPVDELIAALETASLAIPGPDGGEVNVALSGLEGLRDLTDQLDTASSGLVALLELARRAVGRPGSGWAKASRIESSWQPSVAAVIAGLDTYLDRRPTVADTLWWLVSRFVLPVHERIAYSKLPEFTFRFRWEDGLLHFYDNGIGRFPLAAIRRAPLALLTRDLGLWDFGENDDALLTGRGTAFIDEVFT